MRNRHMSAVAAILLLAVSACGSAEEPRAEREVATLQSAAATTAATTGTAASKAPERPRERLDTTAEEFMALLGPFNKCMRENGVDFGGDDSGGAADRGGAPGPAEIGRIKPQTPEQEEKYAEAQKVCEPQYYPLPPWEKDPANPEARDFAVAVVKCLKKKDVEFVAVSDDGISIALGGDDNDARSIRRGMDLLPECERRVAAAMK
jgi:hypothetical protein